MPDVVDSLKSDVPAALTELKTLGRTLPGRATDVLAYFDKPSTSNGPTEAIQRPPRTPPRIRPRLPQPHQQGRKVVTGIRRLQSETTLWISKNL